MSSSSGTANPSARKTDTPRIEILDEVNAEILSHNTPRGFGTFPGGQRYQELFDDETEAAPSFGYQGGGGLGGGIPRPFSQTTFGGESPYKDTVIVIHHNKQGIRLFLQANIKTFLIILLVIIAIVSSPSLTEIVNTLIKTVLSAH